MLFWRACVLIVPAVLTGCVTPVPVSIIDRITPEALAQSLPVHVDAMTLAEVVELSKKRVSPESIIEKLKRTKAHFDLTPSQTVDLANQGVDTKVLDYIHLSHQQAMMDELADEYQQREQVYRAQQDALEQQLRLRPTPFYSPYYDPYWGYYPYWYRFSPRLHHH